MSEEVKLPRMAKPNTKPSVGSLNMEHFDGNFYWNLITIKNNKPVASGGIASKDMYEKIINLYLKYSKARLMKSALELDGTGQLHFHGIVVSHKKTNGCHFMPHMRKSLPGSDSYTVYNNEINTQAHLDNSNRYLNKEDQSTVLLRYGALIAETQFTLPNVEPKVKKEIIIDFMD